ncbi:MAG: hypothetical protein ACI9XP_001609 [Lentimonas sp.]|jgi:hypothetical protein
MQSLRLTLILLIVFRTNLILHSKLLVWLGTVMKESTIHEQHKTSLNLDKKSTNRFNDLLLILRCNILKRWI